MSTRALHDEELPLENWMFQKIGTLKWSSRCVTDKWKIREREIFCPILPENLKYSVVSYHFEPWERPSWCWEQHYVKATRSMRRILETQWWRMFITCVTPAFFNWFSPEFRLQRPDWQETRKRCFWTQNLVIPRFSIPKHSKLCWLNASLNALR